jgi:steroid delta-isomerase-like uncharacterized protein
MSRASIACLGLVLFACGGETPQPKPVPDVAPSASASAVPSAASAVPVVVDAAAPLPVAPPAPPLAELQLAALKTAADAINKHDASAYAALFTSNAIHREMATPRDIVGATNIARRMQLLFDSFADFKLSFDRVLQKGNIAIAEWRWTGTDSGGFMGKKASNRKAGLVGVSVAFFNTDGRIREIHLYEDGQSVVSQLDASAKPGSFRTAATDSTAPLEVVSSTSSADEDKNLAVARSLYDAIEAKNETASAALFSDDAVSDDYALPVKTTKGPAAWKATLKNWSSSFGSFTELPLFNLMAVNDWVVAERVLKGTVPGGSIVSLHCADVLKIKDGKIVSMRTFSNTLELIGQIGARGTRKTQ